MSWPATNSTVPAEIVVHGFRERDRLLAHLAARALVEQRRRRFFDDFLVAALDRAFALAEIDHIAVLVAKHLDLDVAGIDDELFDEHPVVAKRGLGFGLGEAKAFSDLCLGMRDPHALAAAARGRLDHHGIADLVGDLHRMLVVFDDAEMAGNGRDLGVGGRFLGLDLVTHGGNRAWIRTDEDNPRFRKCARKRFALGEKSVAGVNGFGPRLAAGLDDLVDQQIAFGRRRRPDKDRIVRHFDMKGVAVGLGIDRNRLNTHPAGGLDDAAGDLAAVSDQNSFEHFGACLRTFWGETSFLHCHAAANVTIRRTAKPNQGNGLYALAGRPSPTTIGDIAQPLVLL